MPFANAAAVPRVWTISSPWNKSSPLSWVLRHAQLLILDEPTSALTFDEVKSLFRCVSDLQAKGIGIIYITHRLAEVFEIATHRTCRIRCHITNLEQPVQVPVLRDIIQTSSNDLLRFPARNIRTAKQDTPAKHLVHAEYRCCHFCTPRRYLRLRRTLPLCATA